MLVGLAHVDQHGLALLEPGLRPCGRQSLGKVADDIFVGLSLGGGIAAVGRVEELHQAADIVAGERVVDRLRLAPRPHQALAPQHRELLRHRRLAHAQQSGQLADRLLALGELAQHEQPMLVGEQLHELGDALGRRFHLM